MGDEGDALCGCCEGGAVVDREALVGDNIFAFVFGEVRERDIFFLFLFFLLLFTILF